MKRQRFTKTEAIVVLASVAILLALILLSVSGLQDWVVGRGGSRPRQTYCCSSMKYLGTSSALYAGDNAGVQLGPVPSSVHPLWDTALAAQMGVSASPSSWNYGDHAVERTLGVFLCPNDEMAFRLVQARHFAVRMDYGQGKYVFAHPAWGFATTYEFSHPLHRSYSMNLGDNEIAPTANKIPAYSIESGSGTVYLCELHDERNLLGKPDLAALSGKEFTSMIFDAKKAPYHGTLKAPRVNILFLMATWR